MASLLVSGSEPPSGQQLTTGVGRSPGPRRTPSSGSWYAHYVDAHWNELITRYQPSVLWNDISYPKLGKPKHLFADYYNWIPEGVINDRVFAKLLRLHYSRIRKIRQDHAEEMGVLPRPRF